MKFRWILAVMLFFWNNSMYSQSETTGNSLEIIREITPDNTQTLCTASGGCDEFISRVQAGTIDNSTTCDNYTNYTATHSTNLPVNGIVHVTVTNGKPIFPLDQCGIWVDWNRDGDFYDSGETISVSGSPGIGPYLASIIPPSGTTQGPVTMRIRISYNSTPLPCGIATFGEVEDYTLSIVGQAPNYWTGNSNHYWHNPLNWSLEHIPTSNEEVFIPNQGAQPVYVDASAGTTSENCYNLTIQPSASLQMMAMPLNIGHNLINNGLISVVNASGTISIGGNWNDYAWPSGFQPGAGKVVFNGGNYHQYCTNETFNLLEINKPAGGEFRVNGGQVSCAAYDWTAGALNVQSGSFTANDLIDDGLFGKYYCNPGGTITLTNSGANHWVDLNGELHIYGGTVTLHGNSCWIPYVANAVFEMTNGVLDVPDCLILISNNHLLTSNITGGTIRTAYDYYSYRTDFNPGGGTLEFYGPNNSFIYQVTGSSLYNVNINKTSAKSSGNPSPVSLIDEHSGLPYSSATLGNSISLSTNVNVSGNLTINNGSLILNGKTANVIHYCQVKGSLVMNNPADILNCGSSGTDYLEFATGSNSQLTAGTINPYSWVWCSGPTTMTSSPNHVINFSSATQAGITASSTGGVFGTVNLNRLSGNTTYFYSDAGSQIEMVGPLNISAGNTLNMYGYTGSRLVVHNKINNHATSTISGLGQLVIDSSLVLNGSLVVGTGSVLLHGNLTTISTSSVTINGGQFVCDVNNTDDWQTLNGHLGITDGIFQFTIGSPKFYSNSTFDITGGTIKTGGAFAVISPTLFQPTGGTVELNGLQNGYNLICDEGSYFYNLVINHAPSSYAIVYYTDLVVHHNLTINRGELYLQDHMCSVSGNVEINNEGLLYFYGSSMLKMGSGSILNVNNGGFLRVYSVNMDAKVTRISSGNYSMNINSGGKVDAIGCTFEYMGVNGVNFLEGSIIDGYSPFNNCTFQKGAAGGALMTMNNSQVKTLRNINFPANTWGGSYNVKKTNNAGHLYFLDFSGSFSGESFDHDPNNLIDWVDPLNATASAQQNTLCAGYPTQLNVSVTGGKQPLTYLWTPATGLSNRYVSNPVATPLTSTTYEVRVTDFLGSFVESSVTITVNPSAPASVSIAASANPSPPGNFVQFTATPVNGGSFPGYQWKVNGENVGTGLNTYSYVPLPNDQITCAMTSSLPTCFYPDPAISNTITMAVVPVNTVVNGTVPAPLDLCFDASNTVTVAGASGNFLVNDGASATLIAGQKISMFYGTRVMPGGYLHAFITTNNGYCAAMTPSMVNAIVSGDKDDHAVSSKNSGFFRVYPNPVMDEFTVEATGDPSNLLKEVSVFNLNGVKIGADEMHEERSHRFSSEKFMPGIYILRVKTIEGVGVSKLIRL